MNSDRGFTLLEILIALAVLALTSIALLSQTSHSVMTRTALHDKTLGLWVVEDSLERLRLDEPWPEIGARAESIEMGDREWQVSIEVTATSRADMRRVEVAVKEQSLNGEFDKTVIAMTSFMGQY